MYERICNWLAQLVCRYGQPGSTYHNTLGPLTFVTWDTEDDLWLGPLCLYTWLL